MRLSELEEAYASSYKDLVRLASRQLAKAPAIKSETPEDIVQWVFLHLLQSTDDGEDPRYVAIDPLTAGDFLRECVYNRVINLITRGAQVVRPVHEDIAYLYPGEAPPSPMECAQEAQLRERISQVIQSFQDAATQDFLTLVYLEDWTPREAMAKTGFRNMSSTMSRFRERLAQE